MGDTCYNSKDRKDIMSEIRSESQVKVKSSRARSLSVAIYNQEVPPKQRQGIFVELAKYIESASKKNIYFYCI